MRKLFVAVLAILFLLPVFSNAQSQRDGKWWKKLDQNAKIYFVAGFWNGVTWGDDVLADALSNLEKNNVINEDIANALMKKWTSYTNIGSTTVGDIVGRIDNLYSDIQNETINLSDAMTLVVLNIQGLSMSDQTMQQLIQYVQEEVKFYLISKRRGIGHAFEKVATSTTSPNSVAFLYASRSASKTFSSSPYKSVLIEPTCVSSP
jgi:hypothetical protein